MLDALDQFRESMQLRGLIPPVDLVADGKLHRCNVEGRGGESDGAYLLHLDGYPAGGFENHKDGHAWENWRMDQGRAMSPDEEQAHRAHVEAMRKERDNEDRMRKAEARARAKKIWESGPPCIEHPYLTKKGIKPYKVRLAPVGYHQGEIIVPVRDKEGTLHSIQFISGDGEKLFLSGGRKKGCYYSIGTPTDVLYVCEGFATAASIHQATGKAVAVAFDAGNLLPVAQALRAKLPSIELVICADDDYRRDENTGLNKATEAAKAVGGRVVLPVFSGDRPEGATDFNDLHQAEGLEAVRSCIEGQRGGAIPAPLEQEPAAPGWPVPLPLTSKIPATPYPIDALPRIVRAAVDEVHGFVQAPVPLVASAAIGAVSLATQAHNDMKRAEKLSGPVGLFLLTIAESGERKSTCDGFFTQAIRQYEAEQAELAKPLQKDYRAALEAWKAEAAGITARISQEAKKGADTAVWRAKLRDLEHEMPEEPRVPRLRYEDATPEKLKWNLAKVWPSGGIVSSEAGSVFGAHGMGKDSIMRNLATFDLLWDGADIATERRTTESFTVRGARLTIALQVQEATLRAFLLQSGELARGIGFLARCLVAWPESTQGFRPFMDAPNAWPALGAFNRRMGLILNQGAPISEDGALTPAMLEFTTEAKAAWVAFHDRIERELCEGGILRDVRDVASKIADNASRLAALFHVFEGVPGTMVGADSFNAGARIAEWHLNESRRFFGELALPPGLANAARLEDWLVKRCHQKGVDMVTTQEVQQFGPNLLRKIETIEAAALELAELGRLHVLKEGKRKCLAVNPCILRVGPVATAIPAIPAIPAPQAGCADAQNSNNSENSSSNPRERENAIPADGADKVQPLVSVPAPLPLVAGSDWNSSEPVEV